MAAISGSRLWGVIIGLACLGAADVASAQYSFIETPFNSASHSFYENIGTAWGVQGRGWFFNFGGGGIGNPAPFGGFDPNDQANFGTGFRGNGFSGNFRMTAGQGSDSTLTSSTPGVMVPNGGMGFFSDVQQRPFVLGVVPVVGEPVSPVRWRLDRIAEQGNSPGAGGSDADRSPEGGGGGSSSTSSASRGDMSVAAIKAQQAAENEAKASEVAELIAKARELEAAGKSSSAKIHYRRAALRATGKVQQEIAAKIRELEK
ncbi:MAG: hypothetical protein IAF94_04340 [Pirellulaceae bacterium]|nr:hypothetical protein [Pirellulaceae bacterium]